MAAISDNPELSSAFDLNNSFWYRFFEAKGHDNISTSQLSNIYRVRTLHYTNTIHNHQPHTTIHRF